MPYNTLSWRDSDAYRDAVNDCRDDDPRAAGADAYASGEDEAANPYDESEDAFWDWADGYEDARSADD